MISQVHVVLLRLRAADAGLDHELPASSGWLCFGGAGNLATVWLRPDASGGFLVAAAPHSVATEVAATSGVNPFKADLPPNAVMGWRCETEAALDALCRRIAVLGHVLPNQPLQRFEHQVASELATLTDQGARDTERVAQIRQRVGQSLFRESLMDYWGGRCPVSGVTTPALLRASHAKPWADATDAERLDVHNGLLLASHLDAAFDAGLIAISPDGRVLSAPTLTYVERGVLGLSGDVCLPLSDAHQSFLAWHRQHVFRSS